MTGPRDALTPVRLLALALAALFGAAALAATALVRPALVFRPETPGPMDAFRQSAVWTAGRPPLEQPLAALVWEVAAPAPFRERLATLCRGLRGRMPGHPEFSGRRGTPWPARPLTTTEVQAAWDRCRFTDTLSTAFLAMRIGRAAGLDCRVIAADSGAPWPPGCVAGLEARSPEGGWVFVDPTYGLAFSHNQTQLSLLDLRRRLAASMRVDLQRLVDPAPFSPLGAQWREYAGRLNNVWLPLETPWELRLGGRAPTWALLEDDLACLAPRRLLAAASAGGPWPVPAWVPRSAAAQLALACLLLYCALLLLHRRDSIATRGRLLALPTAALGDLGRLCVDPPASLLLRLLALARPAASSVWTVTGRTWRRWSEGPSDLYPVRPGRFLLAALPALALLALQLVWLVPTCWEDAYISFRFARNVAAGDGWTFNRGEPGVEGFSNAAWTGLLAVAAGSAPGSLPAAAAGLGAGLQALTLLLVAWMACRLGPFAWLPALLLAGNATAARNASSGLETPLACLLTTLVAWLWLTEQRRGMRGPALTSAACALLAATRAEGFSLFLALTVFRSLSARGDSRNPALDPAWLLPFAAGFGALTVWRLVEFGSAIPHVYFARLVEERGNLLQRLGPGALYLARSFAASPAWLAAGLGLLFLRHSPAAARLAAVAASHLAVVAAAGGAAVYMPLGRFLLAASPCLALLAQHGLQGLASRAASRRPATLAALATLALLAVELSTPPDGWRVSPAPLARALATGRAEAAERLTRGWWHLTSGRVDATLHSFDGRVARHLAAFGPTDEELCSSQAGQLAWLWPGRFRDYLGLATLPPVRTRYLEGTCGNPRWILLPPHILADRGQLLLDRGYRLRLAYMLLEPHDPAELSCLVLLERPQVRERGPLQTLPFVQAGRLAWWALPRDRVVLFANEAPSPLFDGPRGGFDPARWSALRPATRDLLAAYGWNLR